jgi:tetratricopeptide (TPR) repeat protein
MGMRYVAMVVMLCAVAWGQASQKTKKAVAPHAQSGAQQSSSQPSDSSSKDNKIDLSPPKGDEVAHADPDDDDDASGVMETKPWNPHKAAKDIEVGDFYAKRKNYKAAISRYREALEYKPRDAEATFKLAQCLEASKAKDEALQRYEEYLRMLPNGEFAPLAKAGVERLKKS